jgi:glycosyltransferase involved in cell wall biosynthesis
MIRRAAIGASLARRPLVVKLVSDEVYERATRGGRYGGTLDAFQLERGDARTRFLRATRNRALRSARHVFCPSAYLREVALGWGLDPERVSVLPNPAPEIPSLPPREELRRDLGLGEQCLVFAGRLGPQKSLGTALEALRAVPEVTLAVAGDGPERGALEERARELGLGERVSFLGSVPREHVLRLFRAADASLLPSAWENFPHTVVEALAVGCPVIATGVGGVPEIVRDGENGLLVPPRDPDALAAAIGGFFADDALRARLSGNAALSVEGYSEALVFATIEAELAKAAA